MTVRSYRLCLLSGFLAGAAALVSVASAGWGCVAMATLDLTPAVVEPGQRLDFEGSYYHDATPVILRWDSVDGPPLATVLPAEMIDFHHAYWRSITGTLTVPADAPPGPHVVLATQEASAGRPVWGVPSRALVQVGGEAPPREKLPTDGSVGRLSTIQIKAHGGPAWVPVVAVGAASAMVGGVGAGVAGRRRARRRALSAST
ncbi:MAG TPA: hypothetical protein VNA57_14645 [Acidimicrobiales bacterium]|nr:hypothetical protein [Acidimicrobiales bacterium]